MGKLKIPKSASDRFKITATGKILRRKSGAKHLRINKTSSNKRRDALNVELLGTWKKKVGRLLGTR